LMCHDEVPGHRELLPAPAGVVEGRQGRGRPCTDPTAPVRCLVGFRSS
jgi:hypothetical protein